MYLGIQSLNDTIYFRANTVNKQGSSLDASAGPTFFVYPVGSSTELSTGTMSKVGTKTGHYEGFFIADDVGFSDGQHFILIEATVDGETPSAHMNFQLVSDEQSIEETFTEIQLIGDSIPIIGAGSVSIDHNFGGVDNYRVTASGTPLADVAIRAFVKGDYDAGRKANRFVVGQTKTKTDGRWLSVIRLDPGDYTLEFSKKGDYRTKTVNITISGVGSMSFEAMGVEMYSEATTDLPAKTQVLSFSELRTVDHNFGGRDQLRVIYKGNPIKGADIKVYRKSDYDKKRRSEEYIVLRSVTKRDGRWLRPLKLASGTYILEISKKDLFEASTVIVTI